LFFGSDHGGERVALLYSLIGTCKLNGVDPESYLRHVLDVIADWTVNRVRVSGENHIRCNLNTF
ncbi:TPA: transposase domain-containing protein, partial [Salmonella enterica]|nr:transposase domain-containing protein [Salmonella enterica]EHP7187722.1 transposase domain-containing protein [Salmonella enterica subsp. enterica serovar Thompson]EHL8728518.1 transposase domain-containing protein [Salmonella enterica]EHM5288561.1 transposase domain-containing protein [Salmonella enterica]MBM9354376.1 transposase domain-containing protein [Salmonella enterica]